MHKVHMIFIFLLINLVSENNSLETNTLTTATIRQNISPRPTTFHRRINVQKEEMSSSSEIFTATDEKKKKRKKAKTSFWTWDDWCQLQPKEGKCEKQVMRFYYNLHIDECATFNYSGCDGNKNNFETIAECERHCKGSGLMSIIESPSQPNLCYLQPDSGLCLALLEKYFYDINTRTCKKFTYGGCGGNQNKFNTLFSCMRTCNDVKS